MRGRARGAGRAVAEVSIRYLAGAVACAILSIATASADERGAILEPQSAAQSSPQPSPQSVQDVNPVCRPLSGLAGCTVSFVLENDLFSGTDEGYTNGFTLRVTSGEGDVLDPVRRVASPFIADDARLRATYAIGQNLYTPTNISTPVPDPTDRPYAGWLYGSVGLLADDDESLTSLELSLGVVGPLAFGKETQTIVHDLIDSTDPNGWGSQLGNEPAVLLTLERKWKTRVVGGLFGFGIDAAPYVGGALGNVFTHANAGFTFRIGTDLPRDYGPPRIQPSTPGSGFFEPVGATGGSYLFGGIEARAVAYNMFLDGTMFSSSPSVEKNIFVGDFYTGIAINYGDLRFSYTHVFRSPEYDDQDGLHSFGAFGVTMRF
jgi:lipid A 3-O-deacylase